MDQEIAEIIIRTVQELKPETVEQLVSLIKEKTTQPEKTVVETVVKLQNEGKIVLRKPVLPPPQSLGMHLATEEAAWYWATLLLSAAATIAAFTIPENAFPIVYLRNGLGAIFVLFLPGFSFVRALFPKGERDGKSLEIVERLALSVGLSLALVPLIGLLLNYTPWGIRLFPIVLSLFTATIVFASVAIVREYHGKIREG